MEIVLPQSKIETNQHFNQDYFKTWSEGMAYTLGLLNSCGWISRTNVFDITVPKKDKFILKQIAKDMGFESSLRDTLNKQVARLTFCNRTICDDVTAIHVFDIPDKYRVDFIRGSLDGLGKVKRVKNNRINLVFQENEYRVIELLVEQQWGIKGSYDERKGTVTYGNKASRIIGDYIYRNDPKFYSKRKRDKFKM